MEVPTVIPGGRTHRHAGSPSRHDSDRHESQSSLAVFVSREFDYPIVVILVEDDAVGFES